MAVWIRWPDRSRYQPQTIPLRTRSIRVTISGSDGSVIDRTTTERPPDTSSTTSRVTSRIQAGTGYGVKVEAFQESEPTESSQAIAVGTALGVEIRKSKRTVVTISLGVPSAPRIDSIDPALGWPGLEVLVKGANFGAGSGLDYSLAFGGVTATSSTRSSDTEITAVIPVGAVTGNVAVTVDGIKSVSTTVFTVMQKPSADSPPVPGATPGSSGPSPTPYPSGQGTVNVEIKFTE